jgi:hypothetical protein
MIYITISYYINEGQTQFGLLFLFHLLFILFWVKFKEIKFPFYHIVLMGCFYLGTPAVFENDHHRYLWEGKVIAAGENPYLKAPNDKSLDFINYEEKKKISYNKLTSIYPPIAQLFFTIVSPFKYKTAFFLMQLMGLLLCMTFLYYQLRDKYSYLILLSPFFLKEFIQSVHIDILAVSILLILFNLNYKNLGIFLSFFTKILSLLVLPFYIIQNYYNSRKEILFAGLVIISIGIITFLYPTNLKFVSGAEAFIKFWFWNSLIGKPLLILGVSAVNIRIILAVMFGGSYLYLLWHQIKNAGETTRLCSATAFMFLFLFSPVLHPWYLIWPLTFMPSNKYYNLFVFSSFLAYAPYGMSFLSGYAEVFQMVLLVIAIRNNLTEMANANSSHKLHVLQNAQRIDK